MKTLHHLLYLLIVISIASNISMGEKMTCPSTVDLAIDTTQPGVTTTVTIQCSIYVAVKECQMKLEVRDVKGAVLENIMLWEGKSNTKFNKQFIRSITIPEGDKLSLHVSAIYSEPDGEKCGSGANLYIHHTSKGKLYDEGSFYGIGKRELWKEAWDKGYKGLTIEQIMERDPEMGKRLDAMNTIPGKLGPGSADPNINQRRLKERELWKEVWDKGYKGLTIEEILKRDPEMGKKIREFYNLGPGETMPKVAQQTHSSYYEDTTKYNLTPPNSNEQVDTTKSGRKVIHNPKGTGIKQPRYDTIDSLAIKMKRESRKQR